MIDVRQITFLHETTVKLWHRQEIVNPYRDFLYQVCEQHKFNFLIWHEHDLARGREVSDEQIAGVKRAIDRYNQQRNDWIERLDDHLKRMLDDRNIRPSIGAKHNSETPAASLTGSRSCRCGCTTWTSNSSAPTQPWNTWPRFATDSAS